MRMHPTTALAVAGFALLAAPALSQSPEWGQRRTTAQKAAQKMVAKLSWNGGKPSKRTDERNARSAARNFRRLKVPGEEVAANVAKLTKDLRWHSTLGGALANARNSQKPVLWIQALGELDGFL